MNMKPLSLETIAAVTGGIYHGDSTLRQTCITGVVRDNREVQPGNLFLCIKGNRTDGHRFAPQAFAAGAACCLAERIPENTTGPVIVVQSTLQALKLLGEYYRSLFTIPIIGVTGSVGKTTAKEMTAAVLSQKYCVLKTPANLNNEIGVPLTLLSLREEHEAAVVEMGISDFGEMTRLAKMVRPTICIMTTIGYCHLENLIDLDGVLKAKSEVYQYMAPDAYAIVNGDDEKLRAFDPGVRRITFGLGAENDYRGTNIRSMGTLGVACDITSKSGQFHVKIPAFGSHMVLAALPAAAVGHILGLSDAEITRGFLSYSAVGGRANVSETGYIILIDDCYNANPNSVTAALLSLAALPGRKVAILGDMKELGADADNLHREVGVLADKCGIDCLICCGDKAVFIYKGIISCGTECEAWYFPMKDALLSVLPSLIHEGDNVLVKASHSMQFEEITEALKTLR